MAYSYGMSFKSPMQEKTPEDWKKKVNDLFDQPPSIEDWQKQVAALPDWQSAGKLYNSMPSLGSVASRRKANPYWGSEYRNIIRENPHWQEWARRLHEVNKNRGGMLHGIGRALSDYPGSVGSLFNTYQGREMAIKAGLFAAGMAGLAGAGGAFAGGGAAGGAGGGLTAGQAAAAGVDPFLAGGGLAGGGVAAGAAGAGGGLTAGQAAAANIDPFLANGGLATKSAGTGSFMSKLFGGASRGGGGMDWGEIIKNVGGTMLGSYLNKQQVPGKDLSRSPYESGDLQRYLPPELRAGTTGPMIGAGIGGIGELLRNPGGLSPNVAESILPRVSAESQRVAQEYRGIQSNQAGAAARNNLPVSIKGALQSALDVAQERAQRGVRNEALQQSETMRRADLERVFQILDAILQFQQAGRGTATAGIGAGTALESQKNAAMMALVANLFNSGANKQAA